MLADDTNSGRPSTADATAPEIPRNSVARSRGFPELVQLRRGSTDGSGPPATRDRARRRHRRSRPASRLNGTGRRVRIPRAVPEPRTVNLVARANARTEVRRRLIDAVGVAGEMPSARPGNCGKGDRTRNAAAEPQRPTAARGAVVRWEESQRTKGKARCDER